MARANPNRLLVEGEEDKRVIPYFMEYFIPWGNNRGAWPVEIEAFNGIEEMLKPGVIEAELRISRLQALGIWSMRMKAPWPGGSVPGSGPFGRSRICPMICPNRGSSG
jgi:hypothetical protein